jgi:hypothetical protein
MLLSWLLLLLLPRAPLPLLLVLLLCRLTS